PAIRAELLFGLGEGSVGRGHAAIAHADGRRALDRLEVVALEKVAALPDVLREGEIFPHQRLALRPRHREVVFLFVINQTQILHGEPSTCWSKEGPGIDSSDLPLAQIYSDTSVVTSDSSFVSCVFSNLCPMVQSAPPQDGRRTSRNSSHSPCVRDGVRNTLRPAPEMTI